MENCTGCKYNIRRKFFNEIYDSINEMEIHLDELKKGNQGNKNIIYCLNDKLNRSILVLCEYCKRKEIKKLVDECGNEEIAKFLYDCKPNSYSDDYVKWIPFDEFRNIEYLAEGGFGEVHKATWIDSYYDCIVLKRIYNSNNKILDVLKEVK